jgi:hypothetical protein
LPDPLSRDRSRVGVDRAGGVLREPVVCHIGFVVAALFALGLLVQGRRHWKLCAAIAPFVWLSFGERPTLSLFALLHRQQVFRPQRGPA